MRVLVLLSGGYGERGGIPKFNRDLLQALASYPETTEVVALPRSIREPPGEIPAKVAYRAEAAGGKLAFVAEAMKQALRGGRFDLVVCGHIHLLPLGVACRTLCRAPLVLVLHGVDAWQATGRLLTDTFAKRANYSFASVSELTKARFMEWSGARAERAFVLPNCFDPQHYRPGNPPPALVERYNLSGRRVIMTLACLFGGNRQKGVDQVIEVMPSLLKQVPDLTYLVAGDGPDRERLQEKARRLGLSHAVVFTGYVPEAAKADHYRLAEAFVLAGFFEGFGIVLLEALACGLPVVASKLDGSREAIRDGELGVLVDPADPEDLSAGVLKALARPAGIVPDGLAYFSTERFDGRCHDLLDRVLA